MGFIEKYVQICKILLKKSKNSSSDPHLAILEYRNTPIEGINLSPTQMRMGRRTQTQFSIKASKFPVRWSKSTKCVERKTAYTEILL